MSRIETIVERLRARFPGATTALRHRNPFELLVATILSAQTTDEQVNRATPALFARFPTADKLAKARGAEVAKLVRSVNFFRTKAKNLVAMARTLVKEHQGEVPRSIEALVELPGVARKTANVVLGTCWGIASGIVVDTHVFRAAARLGLAAEKTPARSEAKLMEVVPREAWVDFGHLLIWHGRKTCRARAPQCGECVLADLCSWEGKSAPIKNG
jgi:endonuclease-3